MSQKLLTQQENKLTISETTLEDINLHRILKWLNAKLIFYWKKLIENGYILFLQAGFENNNKIYYLTYKEAHIKKEDRELRVIQITIRDAGNQPNPFNSSSTSLSCNTLTTFCLFNLGSLDHIGHLSKDKETAKYATSFLSGDIFLASPRNCEYSTPGITLTKSDINFANATIVSPSVVPNTLANFL